MRRSAVTLVALACALAACERAEPPDLSGPLAEWPHYGGDEGGTRWTPLTQVAPANVERLEIAWVHHTGDVSDGRGEIPSTSAFEATPIVVDGALYVCTPFNRVLALDPETGAERWSFDPKIDLRGRYSNQLVCRGVAHWRDPARATGPCAARIFTATNAARLHALDAATGLPCGDFGASGAVDLAQGVGETLWKGEYHVTSAPVVAAGVVIVGSAIGDNQRTDAPSGAVRGYDARTGAPVWSWDLSPPRVSAGAPRAAGSGALLGTPNSWAPMSVDAARGLVFVPTGNPAPDYYGGARDGIDHYGSAVVALRAATGEVVWSFQTVHHDVWDFDVPAQPTLATLLRDGREVPAVVQATKMGMLFVLHRETGEPLFPIEERAVPQSDVPGERTAPTQPFPLAPPPLVPHRLSPGQAWGLTAWDRGACRRKLEAMRGGEIYTPPALGRPTLMYPGNGGGSNWGGIAFEPRERLAIANVMDVAWAVTLLPAADFAAARAAHPGVEISPQRGTPYAMRRELVRSPLGVPCNPPPWGTLAAVDLDAGTIRWQVPLGTIRDIAPVPIPWTIGVPNLGGPLVTASGLVFIAAAMDDYLRAFDLESGRELWRGRLPAGGQATPMTYRLRPDSRQYVVIAAGGHGRAGTRLGDALVAFALPE
jgi:quinoprotein glucose dehydrogenase